MQAGLSACKGAEENGLGGDVEILHGGAEGQLGVLYSSSSSKNRGNAVKMEVSESNGSEEAVP